MKRFWTNYHSHNYYCDGSGSLRVQVEGALQQGVLAFGFSSHGPLNFLNLWSMKSDRMEAYLAEARALKEEFAPKIELYVGLEIDYLPAMPATVPMGPSTYAARLDYTIGSVHYLDHNENGEPWEIDGATDQFMRGLQAVHGDDIQKVIRLYYARIREMVQKDPPTVIGHLDKIKIHNVRNGLYDEQAAWYQAEIDETLHVIAESGCLLEVNTRGLYKKNLSTYPSLSILKKAHKLKIPVMINSDSHAPSEITSRLGRTALQLKQAGFRTLRILLDGRWQEVGFDEEGLYL